MPARSQQRVCVLNEVEAHSVEHEGFLADCRNHRHWGAARAVKEIASGSARLAKPKRTDSHKAVVMISEAESDKGGEWIATFSADGAALKTTQFHHAQR
ncbi:MAG: hypothetical protein JWO13_2726 [Acidobacteriales bacterium]|nr:hypothetical protein [Terriglobales bacterium]